MQSNNCFYLFISVDHLFDQVGAYRHFNGNERKNRSKPDPSLSFDLGIDRPAERKKKFNNGSAAWIM